MASTNQIEEESKHILETHRDENKTFGLTLEQLKALVETYKQRTYKEVIMHL